MYYYIALLITQSPHLRLQKHDTIAFQIKIFVEFISV